MSSHGRQAHHLNVIAGPGLGGGFILYSISLRVSDACFPRGKGGEIGTLIYRLANMVSCSPPHTCTDHIYIESTYTYTYICTYTYVGMICYIMFYSIFDTRH